MSPAERTRTWEEKRRAASGPERAGRAALCFSPDASDHDDLSWPIIRAPGWSGRTGPNVTPARRPPSPSTSLATAAATAASGVGGSVTLGGMRGRSNAGSSDAAPGMRSPVAYPLSPFSRGASSPNPSPLRVLLATHLHQDAAAAGQSHTSELATVLAAKASAAPNDNCGVQCD
jgi:hypothetical protein